MDNISSRINQLQLESICRTCLSKEALRPLFSNDDDEETDVEFTTAIIAVTQLKVKRDDGLPEVICETCRHIVKQAYQFITKSHEADTILREHLSLEVDIVDGTELKEEYSQWEDVSELASLEDDICTVFEPITPSQQKTEVRDEGGIKTCSLCKKEFKSQKSLDKHMAKDHVKRKRGRPRKDVFVPSTTKESLSKIKKSQIKIKTLGDINETQHEESDLNDTKSIEEMDIKMENVGTIKEINLERSESVLKDRQRKRKRVQSFKCWFCSETFDTNKDVIKHYETSHDEKKVYRCSNCDCIYLDYETLKKHGPCGNLTKDAAGLNLPVKNKVLPFSAVLLHSVLPPGDYKAKSTILECEDCGCLLFSKADLRRHIDQRHAEKSLRCHLCSKEFTTLRNAQRHKASCDGTSQTVFECPDCGQEFSAELSLNKHILSQHAGAKASVAFLHNKKKPNPHQNMYSCDKCSESFSRPELLTSHINYEHKSIYECHVCQRKFTRIYNLWSHARVHDPNAKLKLLDRARPKLCLCNFCGQGFTNTSNLIVHVRRHTGEKPYKCDFCDKAYPRSYDLAVHRRTHTGEKPCPCPICGKSFSRSNKLTRHMHIHTGQKPYKCDYCDKAFAQSNDLRVHVRRHTGDKPYCCELCGERFINGSALQTHRRAQGHQPPSTSVLPPSGYMPIKQDSPDPPNRRLTSAPTFAL